MRAREDGRNLTAADQALRELVERAQGEPRRHPDPRVRAAQKVDVAADPDGCWPWIGAQSREGYGRFRAVTRESAAPAHRWLWELLVDPVPVALHMDHLCENPSCVRPSHLEPVSTGTNLARSRKVKAWRKRGRRVTACRVGHDRARWRELPDGGGYCRECRRLNSARFYAANPGYSDRYR